MPESIWTAPPDAGAGAVSAPVTAGDVAGAGVGAGPFSALQAAGQDEAEEHGTSTQDAWMVVHEWALLVEWGPASQTGPPC